MGNFCEISHTSEPDDHAFSPHPLPHSLAELESQTRILCEPTVYESESSVMTKYGES